MPVSSETAQDENAHFELLEKHPMLSFLHCSAVHLSASPEPGLPRPPCRRKQGSLLLVFQSLRLAFSRGERLADTEWCSALLWEAPALRDSVKQWQEKAFCTALTQHYPDVLRGNLDIKVNHCRAHIQPERTQMGQI